MRKLDEPLSGLVVLETEPRRDERGAFARCFCREEMAAFGVLKPIQQGNLSWNPHKATLRGMHLQKGAAAETKIVQCLQGAIFDVGLDMRRRSPTFGRWFGTTLSAGNGRVMVLPEGFAHGFLTLSPETLVHYLVTEAYAPEAEDGFRFDDPAFAIDWPLEPAVISARDRNHPLLEPFATA